MNVFVVIIQLH